MAYRRRSNYSRTRSSGFSRRPATRRSPARRSTGRRGVSSRAGGGVLRIVVETAPASAVSRNQAILTKMEPPSRKAKY